MDVQGAHLAAQVRQADEQVNRAPARQDVAPPDNGKRWYKGIE